MSMSHSRHATVSRHLRRCPRLLVWFAALALPALAAAWPVTGWTQASNTSNDTGSNTELVEQGAYIFRAGGCYECHTDTKNKGAPLAGGRALPTPYGTFYSPNITPDRETGIGSWTEAQFITAMRHGLAPDGMPYYPAFPYTSFTKITDADLRALWAYLMAQPPVKQANKPHDLGFPYNLRMAMWGWRLLFFEPGVYQADAAQSAAWNRGAYLVTALGHCGECHTPRNFLGAMKADMRFAGSADNAEGERVPNITPHAKAGIGGWSEKDIADYLGSGMTPDGDFAGGLMGDVIEYSTKYLTQEDRMAMAAYLKSAPAIDYTPPRKQQK
ncbi:cytochrome c [uncultured Ferrovibrio sp.]|jgi:Cytochrome c, mono- and diheme variants|uniref:c-type cytochrome n=1 Tax=uncultured Ferrovibrio sp. TaxID=1576913 RepID=UPI0026126905|nr:cytochrome c [uncultured Ferrovibrio sp.]